MRVLGRYSVLWRGIWQRRGLSCGIFLMAAVAVAAGSIGASYHGAAATHSLRTTIDHAPTTSKGIELTLVNPGDPLPAAGELKIPAKIATQGFAQIFEAPVLEVMARDITPGRRGVHLSWREGACEHLTITAGRCATAAGEVVATRAAAGELGLKIGSRVPTRLQDLEGGALPLKIVGFYTPTDTRETFWFGNSYFPSTDPTRPVQSELDQFFTAETTLQRIHPDRGPGDKIFLGRLLLPVRQDLRAGDAGALGEAVRKMAGYAEQQPPGQMIFNTTLARTLEDAAAADRTLGVPILVISLQLIVLCWLLLFFTVTDLAEARAPDIALVKLRGLAGLRLLAFGLAEPIVLLALALPAGVFGGRIAVHAMVGSLFGQDVPVEFPGTVWLAAAGAAAGGVAAAVLASRAVLTRPVTEQWRRASRAPARRGWVPEAILLTLVAGGLFQIIGTGVLSGTGRQNAVSLVVPGLLALGAALVGARLLPPACRLLFPRTRRRGGIAVFLALRQIARRPGGARITVALATSFALVVFAVAAWSVARTNQREVARTRVGAPVAFAVTQPPGETLNDFVARADPSGTGAVAVRTTRSIDPNVPTTVAVDPKRFAAVAYWRSDFAKPPLSQLLARLREEPQPPVVLRGDALRVKVAVKRITPTPIRLAVAYIEPGKPVPTEQSLGSLPASGAFQGTARLANCAKGCELRRIFLQYGTATRTFIAKGTMTIAAMEERIAGRWKRVDSGLTDPGRWRSGDNAQHDAYDTVVTAAGDGLTVKLFDSPNSWPGIEPATWPVKMKAIVTPGVTLDATSGSSVDPPVGLNGLHLPYEPADRVRAIPGVSGEGVIVDELTAHRAAGNYAAHLVELQIWTTPSAQARVRAQIRASGMTILAERHAAQEAGRLAETGPGLALALMLAAAVATALLATAGAMLSLYAFARRRTYELAALSVAGARRRVLRRSLIIEQAVILGFGTALGVGTGLLVSVLALPSVPQFARIPVAPPLLQRPDVPLLTLVIAATCGTVAAGAWVMSRRIMSRVHAELLREAPP